MMTKQMPRTMILQPTRTCAAAALLLSAALAAQPACAEPASPQEWLNRMSSAVENVSYEGTVVRVRGDASEALKVARVVSDGVVREKVIAQEGSGLEIIRNGNEVHCILPERESVLVEEWNDQSTLFSSLPSSRVRFGNEYDVAIVREERIAGRKSVLLAIRPHDEYRYGHRIWLDKETGFPLQTKLVDERGNAIAQVKFADIRLDHEIHADALAPSYNIETFTWLTEPRRTRTQTVESEWRASEVPAGFRAVSVHAEKMPGNDDLVTHILFSDGMAMVSVFIARRAGANIEGKSKMGSTNSYSVSTDEHVVTAVGEVPAVTVEAIARAMRRQEP
ncbi:MAG: MucB/RseB C-terminal domain-containing protein [Gammaproteobacteria bacterium]|nr:MucB/RseB C-terminal domain-containing protein [Gammaproteobacteria bacterium]